MNYKIWLRCVVLVYVQIHSSMIGKCPYVDLSKGKREVSSLHDRVSGGSVQRNFCRIILSRENPAQCIYPTSLQPFLQRVHVIPSFLHWQVEPFPLQHSTPVCKFLPIVYSTA